ncbi:hypothetical protein FGO68_gene15065 [Halteria grandinella]|uniref:5'-nucleotidase n=1 Tax=Halteria grandinella TaxID=5974 RepID=A0A8J8NVQ1_HALGN|nr:hypothetical protein FGO68_gene15065 [Halteria grandinella]
MSHSLLDLFRHLSKQKGAIRNFIAPAPCPVLKNFHISDHGDIHIRDCQEVAHKIREIKRQGSQNFQILTDYDQTLTKTGYVDGKKADSSFKALQDSTFIPHEIKTLTRALYEKYHKIELDLTLHPDEKSAHMIDWWEGNFNYFVQMGLKQEDHGNVVLNSRLLLRYGIQDFLSLGSKLDLPLYIVSGGISEIIEANFYAMLHNGETGEAEEGLREYWEKRVQVLSNRFIYENGQGIDYVRPVIHILNKQQFIYDTDPSIKFRKNVLIMGDILEDVQMVRESEHDIVLKVGFLNDLEANAHLMPEFMKTYDIVVTGDGSLQPINFLLKQTFAEELKLEDIHLHQDHKSFETIKTVFA